MRRIELDSDGNVAGSDIGTGEEYPDNTVLEIEDRNGNQMPHGPLRISRYQDDGWEEAAGRAWDEQSGMWVKAGNPSERPGVRALRELAQQNLPAVPDNPTMEEVTSVLKQFASFQRRVRLVLLDTKIPPGGKSAEQKRREAESVQQMTSFTELDRRIRF